MWQRLITAHRHQQCVKSRLCQGRAGDKQPPCLPGSNVPPPHPGPRLTEPHGALSVLAGDATGLQRRGQHSDDGLRQARFRGSQSAPCSVLPGAPPSFLTPTWAGTCPSPGLSVLSPRVNPEPLPCDWPSAVLVICRPDSLPNLRRDKEPL